MYIKHSLFEERCIQNEKMKNKCIEFTDMDKAKTLSRKGDLWQHGNNCIPLNSTGNVLNRDGRIIGPYCISLWPCKTMCLIVFKTMW